MRNAKYLNQSLKTSDVALSIALVSQNFDSPISLRCYFVNSIK